MANQAGIQITIKAWLPTGKTIDEQFEALSIVKNAHASGDYAALLTASKIEAVQTEQKTRRMDDEPATAQATSGNQQGDADTSEPAEDDAPADPSDEPLVGSDWAVASEEEEADPQPRRKGKAA